MEHDLSVNDRIECGIQQGDTLSPDISFLYTEMRTRSIDEEVGVRFIGFNFNIRYSDDAVLHAMNEKGKKLSKLVDCYN